MKEYLSKLRKDYSMMALSENEVDINPIVQFELWISDAANAEVNEPNAMVLSTVDKNSVPHSRIVLLRDIKNSCFSFYTNYNSNKGNDIELNSHVCLNFFWPDLERQVRIEGVAEKMTIVDSNEYFRSRPRESQISAWASAQSTVVESRDALEKIWKDLEEKWKGIAEIEKPPFWGGYLVKPTMMEFWQGRPGRLHDRLRYRSEGEDWILERLAP
jgi:pyridoxamine 5'-phosphate oxidase